mmetsp:Transcript_4941/g.7967  ORF Transcript_4941/g.7967 Transcript_4941/m.7967 type:complete len:202 (+) Transcript_4941:338-943(+)
MRITRRIRSTNDTTTRANPTISTETATIITTTDTNTTKRRRYETNVVTRRRCHCAPIPTIMTTSRRCSNPVRRRSRSVRVVLNLILKYRVIHRRECRQHHIHQHHQDQLLLHFLKKLVIIIKKLFQHLPIIIDIYNYLWNLLMFYKHLVIYGLNHLHHVALIEIHLNQLYKLLDLSQHYNLYGHFLLNYLIVFICYQIILI